MGMMGRLVAAGALFAGISAFNSYSESAAHQSAVEKHQLKPELVAVMDACAESMKRHSRKFKAGAERMSGCACLAKYIGQEFDADEFGGVNAIIDLTMRLSKSGDGAGQRFSSMQSSLESKVFDDWTDSRKMTLLRVVGESLGVCSKPDAQV